MQQKIIMLIFSTLIEINGEFLQYIGCFLKNQPPYQWQLLFMVPTVIQLQGIYQEIEIYATIQNWISHVNKGEIEIDGFTDQDG